MRVSLHGKIPANKERMSNRVRPFSKPFVEIMEED
jgi:hypothetical protein